MKTAVVNESAQNENVDKKTDIPVSQKLRELRESMGLSVRALADRIGWSSSTYANYENRFKGAHLPLELVEALAPVVAEHGLTATVLWDLLGLKDSPLQGIAAFQDIEKAFQRPTHDPGETSNVAPGIVELPNFQHLPKDIPIVGTAECGDGNFEMDQGQIIDYARRPPGLTGARDVFCLYLQGDSMEPAMHRGDLIYLSEKRPPQAGRYVVLELKPKHEGGPAVALFKVLLRRTTDFYEVRQFNPDRTYKVKTADVRRAFRVLTNVELLGL